MNKRVMVSDRYYLHMVIILCLMFGFRFLPPFGPVTEMGMNILGIFLGCIYAWTIGETIWPSILALLLMGFANGSSPGEIMSGAYGNQTLLMVVFSLLFCYGISESGVLAIIAKWILNRKFAIKGPWYLAFAFFLTSAIMSLLTTNTLPVTLLLWTIFYDICHQLNLKPYTPYPTIVMIGIVICGYSGAVIAPYNAFALICFGVLKNIDASLSVNMFAYVVTMTVINVVLIPVLTIFFKLVSPKVPYKSIQVSTEPTTFNVKQKVILMMIPLLCVFMMLPNFLSDGHVLKIFFGRLGTLGILAVLPVLMMMFTYKRERFLDINEGMKHGVTWQLYFLLGTALAISSAIVSEGTGISILLSQLVKPLLDGRSAFLTMAILVALSIIITNCINNIVTLTILTPIAFSYLQAANGNPIIIVALFVLCCLQGVVMPAGSVCGALLHGNTSWLKSQMVYRYAILGEIVVMIVVVLVGIPMASWLFGT